MAKHINSRVKRTHETKRPSRAIEALERRCLFNVVTLTVGTGDGSLSVEVDAFGSYGLSSESNSGVSDATFDPHADSPAGTTNFSGIYFEPAGGFLTEDTSRDPASALPNTSQTASGSTATSTFTIAGYQIQLTQSLTTDGTTAYREAVLTQKYRITNVSGSATPFTALRYIEPNLQFAGPANSDYAAVFSDRRRLAFFDENDATPHIRVTTFVDDEDDSTGEWDEDGYTIQSGSYLANIVTNSGIAPGDVNDFPADAVAPARISDTGGQYSGVVQDELGIDAGEFVVYTTTTHFVSYNGAVTSNPESIEDVVNDYGEISVSDVTVLEEAGVAQITVSRTGDTGGATVSYEVLSEATDTATAGVDYQITSGTLTFSEGETSKAILVTLIDDQAEEDSETVTVNLTASTLATIDDESAILTIEDPSDEAGVVAIASSSYAFSEAGGVVTVSLTRTNTAGPALVRVSSFASSATSGSDFEALENYDVVFNAGELTKDISISLINDNQAEGAEQFQLVLTAPEGGLELGGVISTVVTINDDDSAVQLDSLEVAALEASGIISVTLNRIGSTADAASVDFVTTDGTAQAGTDYTAATGTVTFAPGESSKVIEIGLVIDDELEGSESFQIVLSNPVGTNLSLGTPAMATLIILPDDVISPQVTQVVLTSVGQRVNQISLPIGEALEPTTEINVLSNYQLTRVGSNRTIRIGAVQYDAAGQAIQIWPRKSLAPNRLYQLTVDGNRIRDMSGNPLESNAADGLLHLRFGRGTKMEIVDSDGDRGALRVWNGGYLHVTGGLEGEDPQVSIIDSVYGQSVLSSKRRRGVVDIEVLSGLDGVLNQLDTSVFNVKTSVT